jgi:hypothetical protein
MNLLRMIAVRAPGKPPIGAMKDSGATSALVSSAQEHVVRGIGCAAVIAGSLALSLHDPAFGVDALDGGRGRQNAVTALVDHFEFERRNVV